MMGHVEKKNVQSPKTRTTTNFLKVLAADEKATLF
jgi:hypothetical protein